MPPVVVVMVLSVVRLVPVTAAGPDGVVGGPGGEVLEVVQEEHLVAAERRREPLALWGRRFELTLGKY